MENIKEKLELLALGKYNNDIENLSVKELYDVVGTYEYLKYHKNGENLIWRIILPGVLAISVPNILLVNLFIKICCASELKKKLKMF